MRRLSAVFCFCLPFALSSCFLRGGSLLKAKKLLRRGLCAESYAAFHEVQQLGEKETAFARRAAEECWKQRSAPAAALLFYERLLEKIAAKEVFQKSPAGPKARRARLLSEKKDLQKKAARLSFYTLKNYEKAIKYYKQFLDDRQALSLSPEEAFSIQYHISESFFRLKKYGQAIFELKKISLAALPAEKIQQAMLLQGRALMAQKNFQEAIPLFQKMASQFPQKSAFFRQYLAMAFEGRKDLPAAISELEKIKPPSPFTRKKIRRLRRRIESQPGAAL